MRALFLISLVLVLAAPAQAHLITRPKENTLTEIARSQKANLQHVNGAISVCQQAGIRAGECAWHWKARKWLRREYRETQAALHPSYSVRGAICAAFGSFCAQAWQVSLCEGGSPVPSVNARNGQYLGIFQMGSSERSLYGHGSTAIEQARAAARYFHASGSDWSPWACKPW